MLGRAVPMLLVAAGTAGTLKAAPKLVKSVTDNVKCVITGMELKSLASQWSTDTALQMSVPMPGQHDQVQKFCRAALKAGGDRDPALDLFNNWYQVEWGVDRDHVIWISTGPNGKRDGCAKPVDGDRLMASATAAVQKAEALQKQQAEGKEPADVDVEDAADNAGPDDICAVAERVR